MDDTLHSRLCLGFVEAGRISGHVWEIASYQEGLIVDLNYEVEMFNGPPLGNVRVNLYEIPHVIAALEQAVTTVRRRADEGTKNVLSRLLSAMKDAVTSHYPQR